MCADKIAADPGTYCEAVLGKPNAEYIEWILNPFNWGGEIELSILAAHFSLELIVVSMEAFYLLPFPFGDKGRAYLLYTVSSPRPPWHGCTLGWVGIMGVVTHQCAAL